MNETTERCFGLGNSTDEDEKPILMSSSWYGPIQPTESQSTTPSPDSFPSPSSEILSTTDSRPRDFEKTKTFHLSRHPAHFSETPSPFFDRSVEQNTSSVPFSTRQPPPPETNAEERLGNITHNLHHSSRLSSPHAFTEPFVTNLTHHSEHTSPSNHHHHHLENALGDHLQSFLSFPQVRHLIPETDQLDSKNELYSSNRRMSSFSEGSLQLEHNSHHHNVYLDSNSIRRETGEMIQDLQGYPILNWPHKHVPVTEVDGLMNMTSSLIPISASNRILCNNNNNDHDQCRYLRSLESDHPTENNLYQLGSIYQDDSNHNSFSESYRSILGSTNSLYGINHSPIITFNPIYNHHNTTNE
ncbi:hypothetical protein CROQUDRAFT_325110 [Cronartium quercuum f. sp. fusiforme G11]|uniref:Uncharacterized protein n=1 Tax=Cronartium quercuum f. sp. fusiforme G11 TaxID=708437 RepID=A0A9P6NBE3_9BASI|nr:hypothetical protein CROQUDRAFT_325110 [Cronartium quercuum f. sp. fusiforme G11]